MARPLRAARPDVVVHLAAQTSVGESFHDPGQSCRVNVDGTLALARILMDQLPSALLVHASSAEVYGLSFQSGHPLNEDAPMVPANPYAAARTAIDLALGEMTLRGLRLVRPRLFNLVGAGQSDAFVLPSFCRQFAWAEQDRWPAVIRVGALDRWRDFVDVRDGCDALCAAIRHAETLPPGIAINIASGVPRRVGDVLEAPRRRSKLRFQIEEEPVRLRPSDVERTIGDPARARSLLHWSPVRGWEETLDLILGDWRARAKEF
jgi:GDP-4-dehydro-6-deoxy-D-mannose reductase